MFYLQCTIERVYFIRAESHSDRVYGTLWLILEASGSARGLRTLREIFWESVDYLDLLQFIKIYFVCESLSFLYRE